MSRSKKWLTKGGLAREDSDDELGYEDHPWEWIRAEGTSKQPKEGDTPSRKRKSSAMLGEDTKRAIIGARMGTFTVKVGDAVLLKSPEQGKDWAGLICAFSDTDEDDEEEMCAHIQWFCAPDELLSGAGRKSKSMPEFMPNETYITTDFNMNPLTAINGKAIVMSKDEFAKTYPQGEPPKSKTAATKFAKTIMCRRAVKQRNMVFSEEFDWDGLYKGADSLLELLDWVQDQTKRKPKSKLEDFEYPQKKDVEEELAPTTPKKRKTTSTAVTPKSTGKSTSFITPSNKRIMIKKPLEITPLGTRVLSPSQIMSTPYAHARTTLHVSAVPTSLPCRSTEFETVYSYLHSAITDGSGTCIYISGTPGTGKTATVREVVASLHQAVLQDELDGFNFVEINGMKVTDPHQSYSLLWEALKGDRVSPGHALNLLEHEFSHPNPRRIPCVVLMDELDQLVTRNQSVMYNFFNWPALRHSRLIVLAVANTMDLPERTLSNKISSRLGLTRITFSGYTHTQLMEIISSRLQDVPGNIVDPDAVQFASRKVAAVSGDARRALDICRRAVEIAEKQSEDEDLQQRSDGSDTEMTVDTPSKTGRKKQRDVSKDDATKQSGRKVLPRVTIATIKAAINESTSSPVSQCLRGLPLASKLFLAALLARARQTGVSESTLGDVFTESKHIADVADNSAIHDFLMINQKCPRLLAMGAAAMELVDAGIIVMDARSRGERAGKVRLKIADDQVKSALMNDAEVKGMGFEA